jgi:hypothetical protein
MNEEVPLVIHVINNRYDHENDILNTRQDARVRIHRQMIYDLEISGVNAYMPGREAVSLDLKYTDGGDLLLELPEADLWWLLAIETR